MGIRRRLHDLVNGKLPAWNAGTLRYEGYVSVLDTQLTGGARFAKKLGHPLPVWVVDTSTTLLNEVNQSSTFLDVAPFTWARLGSRIRLDSRYDITVNDVVQTPTYTRLLLDGPLAASFPAGTEVTLYSFPIEVVGTYSAPVSTFTVHVDGYELFIGDMIVFDQFHSIEISDITFIGVNPEGENAYSVTLAEPWLAALVDEQELAFRTFPAYASPYMLAPNQPFIYDRISGAFYEDMDDVREVDTVTFSNDASDPLQVISAAKNTVIYRTRFPVDALLFGRRMDGTVKWDSDRAAVVLIPNEDNRAYLRFPLVPHWEPGQVTSWSLTFEATVDAKVSVTLAPGVKTIINVPGGGAASMTVPMLNEPATEIQIRAFAPQGSEIRIRSWDLAGTEPVRIVSHTTVAHVQGPWLWGSTGALAKRALRLSDVTARADLGGLLSSGFYVG